MDRIPEVLRYKMMINAIVLKRTQRGWNKVHYNILHSPLYLKKTQHVYTDAFRYHSIIRAAYSLYFMKGKVYTWLKQMKNNPMMYYYQPKYVYKYHNNDLFSTNEAGEFLDDLIDDSYYESDEDYQYA